eukprot:gene26315-31641_t
MKSGSCTTIGDVQHNGLTLQKLNALGYETLPHPLYSPDFLPTNYHFFKHLDNFL